MLRWNTDVSEDLAATFFEDADLNLHSRENFKSCNKKKNPSVSSRWFVGVEMNQGWLFSREKFVLCL
jgi:hypothetical protein